MHGRSGILRPITLPFLLALPLLLSLAACEGDDTVINNVPPNAIYGQVSPAVPEVRIAAWQAEERAFTFADSAGYFVLRELEPGIYRLVIDSPSGYHAEVPQVSVGPQDGVSVGVIALNDSPGILLSYSPARDAPAAIATEIVPMLHFSVPMQATSFLTQVRFEPEVAGQWVRMGSGGTDFRFRPLRSLGAGREYQVHILPGLLTTAGEPWGETFSFPIRTLPFIVSAVEASELWDLQQFPPLPPNGEATIATVRFTMPLDPSTISRGVTSPGLNVTAVPIGTGSPTEIRLSVAGPLASGTVYRITIGPLLHDHNGDPLAAPETILLRTQPFSVVQSMTQPNLDDLPPGYSGFVYGEVYNTYVDVESFEEGLSITPTGPEVELVTLPTHMGDNIREIRVQLSNFEPATNYLLRLSPDLMAVDGGRLGQERVVPIHTQGVGVVGATITSAAPNFSGSGKVNPDDPVEFSLSFNYHVDVLRLPAAVEFDPPLAGQWYELSQSFAVSNYRFYPDQPNMLPAGAIGSMRVLAGVPLGDGISLAEDFVAQYQVLPLMILTSYPRRGSVLTRTDSVRLTFNARMDRVAVAEAFEITRSSGELINGGITWAQADRYFEFRPSNLVPGDIVTARLSTMARSANGDTIVTAWETDYRVGPN